MPAMGALVDDHNPLTGELASGEIMDGINFRHIGNKVFNTIAKVIRVMPLLMGHRDLILLLPTFIKCSGPQHLSYLNNF